MAIDSLQRSVYTVGVLYIPYGYCMYSRGTMYTVSACAINIAGKGTPCSTISVVIINEPDTTQKGVWN